MRFHSLFVVLIVAIMLVGMVLFALFWSGENEDAAVVLSLPPESVLEGPAFELPSLPLNPQTMTDAQRQAAIEAAGEDALNAALATGQSAEKANAAAEYARAAARMIFIQPSRD